MTVRETVALWLFLPPPDHLPPVFGDDARVVLHQHPAQHVHRRDLPQPARGGAAVDRLQQRVPVPGVSDRQLIAPGLGDRRPPGGHRGAVAAGGNRAAKPPGPPPPGRGRPPPPPGPPPFPPPLPPGPRPPPPRENGGKRGPPSPPPAQAPRC